MFTIKRKSGAGRVKRLVSRKDYTLHVSELTRLEATHRMPSLTAMRSLVEREHSEAQELGMIGGEPDPRYATDLTPNILRPMLSAPVADLSSVRFDRPLIYEEKYDGERMLCFVRDPDSIGGAEFYSRTLKPLTFPFKIPLTEHHGNCILDGELVFLDELGQVVPICDTGNRSVLYKQYRVFDVQMVNGEYVHDRPLHERKHLLEMVLRPSKNVTITPYHSVESLDKLTEAFDHVTEANGEGLIVKRLDECYASGCRRWIKLKSLHINGRKLEFDLYVDRMLRDKNGIFSVLECGYYADDDSFVRVCSVSSGLSTKSRTQLRRMSCDGRFAPRQVAVTIVADKVTRNGSLRHPIFMRVRNDLAGALQVDPSLFRSAV